MARRAAGAHADGFAVVRAPRLPFATLTEWTAAGPDGAALAAWLRDRLAAADAADAVASVSLALAEALGAGGPWTRELELSAARVLSRMSARATPLGLLATISLGEVGHGDGGASFALDDAAAPRTATHVGLDAVAALAARLARRPEIRDGLRLAPCDDLHVVGGRLHHTVTDAEGRPVLVALAPDPPLRTVLARAGAGGGGGGGATVAELVAALCTDPEVDPAEARAYVGELHAAGVLVDDLAPPVTANGDRLTHVAARLAAVPAAAAVAEAGRLTAAARVVAALDAAPPGHRAAGMRAAAAALDPLVGPGPEPADRLLRTDAVRPARIRLGEPLRDALLDGAELLARLTPRRTSPALARFAEEFRERYGSAEVPLLAALDGELGIGFEGAVGASARAWEPRDAGLLALHERALRSRSREVELTDEDLRALTPADPRPLPAAFVVHGAVAAVDEAEIDRGEAEILLSGVHGPSGARTVSRFCEAVPELAERVAAHLRAEEARDLDAVFAEVVHLPAGGAGDVVRRPGLRPYEIPLHGRGSTDPARTIPLHDLRVTVDGNGRPVLRSARLDRRVVPRITTAHTTDGALATLRFLGALQDPDGPGWISFDWGPLLTAPSTPRVRRGRLVLAPASWRLDGPALAELRHRDRPGRFAAVTGLREELAWPRFVGLADGDLVLWTDLDNVIAVDAMVDTMRGQLEARLIELWPEPERMPLRGRHGRYVHELFMPAVRAPSPARAPAAARPARRPAAPSVRRAFPPGSEWLYARLHGGPATTDLALRETFAPLARRLVADGVADGWHFLRYDDGHSGWHLRIRLHGDPGALHAAALPELGRAAAVELDGGRIRRLLLDTYEREIERYGGPDAIAVCEQIFHADSDAAVETLAALAPGAPVEERRLAVFAGIDALLDDLGLGAAETIALLGHSRDALRGGPAADPVRDRLAADLRAHRAELEAVLDRSATHRLAAVWPVLARRAERLAPLAARLAELERADALTVPVAAIAGSLVHMWVNRLIREDALAEEILACDRLARLRAGRAARERARTAHLTA